MIFFSSNQHGQIFKGFKSSLPFLEKHMHLNIIPPAHNLIQSLNSIYFFNYKYKKPRINFLGDHSSSMATGASSIRQYPNCKFIWIDAHPDINTYDSSYTKNYHGMPLSYLTGLNKPFYPMPFPFLINKLSYQNILYIGIRSIDSYEQKIIEDNNIQVIKTNECNYDINNTYVIDEWQRVQTFEEFQTKALMLRDDKFHEERLELARQNYAKVHLTEEEYYKEFEKRMNDAI